MKQLSEGHKGIMMEQSSNRNPLERCPRPLYSRDSTKNDHTIPHHHQSGNLDDYNSVIKEDYKQEDKEYGVMKELSDGHKDMMESPNNINQPERCSFPLYSRDSTQEDHTIPHHHQSGNLRDSNVDAQEEFKKVDEQNRVMKEFFEGNADLYKDFMMGPHNARNPPERCPRPLYSRNSTQEEIKEEDDLDGVMEEFPKGHTDLSQDTTVESSNYRNPPERCTRPLYSRDSTHEGHTISHHHQIGNLGDDNIFVKEEFKEEYGVMEVFSEGHKDIMELPSNRNSPERCPHTLYSRDSTQEDHTIPHCYKVGGTENP
ncbi:hypothetical protein AB205_0084330, partial [Aquarana catesbeiana]